MARKRAAELSVTAAQAAAFRLSRHHLSDRSPERLALQGKHASRQRSASLSGERIVDVVHDTGGIQAQVMSAAEMSIWTRRRETTRDEIGAALFDRRELVRRRRCG